MPSHTELTYLLLPFLFTSLQLHLEHVPPDTANLNHLQDSFKIILCHSRRRRPCLCFPPSSRPAHLHLCNVLRPALLPVLGHELLAVWRIGGERRDLSVEGLERVGGLDEHDFMAVRAVDREEDWEWHGRVCWSRGRWWVVGTTRSRIALILVILCSQRVRAAVRRGRR